MTQEDKQLLLMDLCARLPYGVHGEYSWKCGKPYERELTGNLMSELILSFNSSGDSEFKPYLRAMSSMTEKEKKERDFYCGYKPYDKNIGESYLTEYDMPDYLDWLLTHHFDYRDLIEKGLAIEAPEGMYKTE